MAFRQIHDDVPVSTSLNQLSHFGERLYWRLLAKTDPWGRLPGEMVKIRDLCIPRLAVADSELEHALEELVRAGRVQLYCVDGVWACQLVDFDRHQPFAAKRRRGSRWPDPPQTDVSTDIHRQSAGSAFGKPLHRSETQDRKTETAEERISGSPTAEVHYAAGLPFSNQEEQEHHPGAAGPVFHGRDLVELSRGLRGADERTPYAIGSVLRGMPEAALAAALEQLERRRGRPPRLDSEVRYLVGTLSTMRREGQYT